MFSLKTSPKHSLRGRHILTGMCLAGEHQHINVSPRKTFCLPVFISYKKRIFPSKDTSWCLPGRHNFIGESDDNIDSTAHPCAWPSRTRTSRSWSAPAPWPAGTRPAQAAAKWSTSCCWWSPHSGLNFPPQSPPSRGSSGRGGRAAPPSVCPGFVSVGCHECSL